MILPVFGNEGAEKGRITGLMNVCDLVSLASPAATVLAAGVAVYVTWSLGKGQLRIAEIAGEDQRGVGPP